MGKYDNRPLKAFVKYDKKGIIVAGSLIVRRRIPDGRGWVQIPYTRCCEVAPTTSTTTTTTTMPPVTPLVMEFTIPSTDLMLPLTGFNLNPIDLMVDWGDGSPLEHVTAGIPLHNYASPGSYTVTMEGVFSRIEFGNDSYKDFITSMSGGSSTSFDGIDFRDSLNLASFDCPNVILTRPDFSFYNCVGLTDANISGCDLTGVDGIFRYCSSLVNVNVDNVITTTMKSWFNGCSGLITLDLSNVDMSMCTDTDSTFELCAALTSEMDADKFWNNPSITIYTECFKGATSISNYADIPNDWKGL